MANGLMASLFLLAVAVQYNDPDPLRWSASPLAAASPSRRISPARSLRS